MRMMAVLGQPEETVLERLGRLSVFFFFFFLEGGLFGLGLIFVAEKDQSIKKKEKKKKRERERKGEGRGQTTGKKNITREDEENG